jgi:hypothetical protein
VIKENTITSIGMRRNKHHNITIIIIENHVTDEIEIDLDIMMTVMLLMTLALVGYTLFNLIDIKLL